MNSWKPNIISGENIDNITRWDSNFAPYFLDYLLLPDINLNRHCLINDISIPKKVINLHIAKSMLKNLNTGLH